MSDEFLVWFDREYPMDETGSRTKYKETFVMDLMRSAFEARRTVSGQPIYQVISRGVCQDVTKEQYDVCEGKRYERRIVYAAPIPATERVAEPEAKAWAAARSMGCADWIKEWIPQLRTVSGHKAMTVKEISNELQKDNFTRAIAEDRGRNPAWFQCVEMGVRMAEKRLAAPIPATVSGQEAVAVVGPRVGDLMANPIRWTDMKAMDRLPIGTKLYAIPETEQTTERGSKC